MRLILILIVFALGNAISTRAASANIHEVLKRTNIIRAIVEKSEKVEGLNDYYRSVQRVEHVYCGDVPKDLKFNDVSSLQSMSGREAWPPLGVGQEGIWLLTAGHDGYRRMPGLLGLEWPVRQGVDSRYDQVVQLASALEAVWLAKTQHEQIELLVNYAQSEVPEVAVGAIAILAEGAPDELAKLTKDVNLRVLPLRAQIAFDQSMTKLDAEQWRTSAQRSRLFNTWRERSAENDNDAILVLTRLDVGIQRKEFTALEVWSFLAPLIKSANATPSVRNRAVHIMRWILNDSQVHDEVFDRLASILGDEGDSRLQLAAAQTLSHVSKLNDEKRVRVSALLDQYKAKAALETEMYSPLKEIPPLLEKALHGG